ncbi:E3 ubiquitin-protein ligase dbl4 [Capsella rubella]|uniref:E3 ubiquitin-protein ligase dbl4 n=1 Tax=Capsella rubella TaxID=81985 RepID=UPI000CD566DE|nr:E3 ubiquitin-protein ligase dbl4 [Capsella rubella]
MRRHDLQESSSKRRRIDSIITGDFTNPKGESSSSAAAAKFLDNVCYRLYIKGLVSNVSTVVDGNEKTVKVAGYGVAICDDMDTLLYEIKESFGDVQISRRGVELMGLILGRGKTKKKYEHLVEEAQSILEKMYCNDAVLVARNDVKFAFRLAREAIASQGSSSVDVKAEQEGVCGICLEETNEERMFSTDICPHRHCFSCVKKHVEVKLLSGIEPTCLEYGCKFVLTLKSCSKVLTSKLIDMWKHKMYEDSIPASEKIYCPYPSCSTLMSKSALSSEADQPNVRSCVKCCGLFCIDCKVPSHTDLSCDDYKKLHPDPLVDDLKLQSLANNNMWRQCIKCRHMIELSSGCNHMTCRCGYEFCYQCGIEWKNNQQSCPSGCAGIGGQEFENPSPDEYDLEGHNWGYHYNNYGGLTHSGDEGGFNEAFYRGYYSL